MKSIAKTYRVIKADRVNYIHSFDKPIEVGNICFSNGNSAYCIDPKAESPNSFTIPFEDLELIIHHEMVKDLTKHPHAVIKALDESRANLLHMAVGIADEYFELQQAIAKEDRENVLEELGDLLFYTEGDLLFFPIPRDTVISTEVAYASIVDTMQLLFETTKRHALYEKELMHGNLVRVFNNLSHYISSIAAEWGFTMQDVKDANMVKLGVRYRDFCYSNDAATLRADKQTELKLA